MSDKTTLSPNGMTEENYGGEVSRVVLKHISWELTERVLRRTNSLVAKLETEISMSHVYQGFLPAYRSTTVSFRATTFSPSQKDGQLMERT